MRHNNKYIPEFILLMAVAAAYSISINSPFQYDDFHQIVTNPSMRSIGNLPRFFIDASAGSGLQDVKGYRPITSASFAFNFFLSGYGPWSYHALNLLLHLVNTLLVFLITRLVTRRAGKDGYGIPLFVSAAFALHPIQTFAVTYISSRAVLLASLFYLAAFYCFVRYRSSDNGRKLLLAATPFFYFMGLLSKEMAVSLPAVMLLYDLFFTYKELPRGKKVAETAALYLSMAILLGLFLIFRRMLAGGFTPPMSYTIAPYIISEAKVFLMYLRLLFFPMNQTIYYGLPLTQALDARSAAGMLIVVLIIITLFRMRKADPAVAFFGGWFLLAIAPESLFPITDIAVEYRLYLPSAGFIAAAALAADRLPVAVNLKKAASAALVLLLCILTFNRNAIWRDSDRLWTDAMSKSSDKPEAMAYYKVSKGFAKNPEISYLFSKNLEAAKGTPAYAKKYVYMGEIMVSHGRPADALADFDQAIKINPNSSEAHLEKGKVLYNLKRYPEAAAALERAASLDAGQWETRLFLAKSYARAGRKADAAREITKALDLSPENFVVRFDAAVIYMGNGDMGEAERQASQALRLAGSDFEKAQTAKLMVNIRGRR